VLPHLPGFWDLDVHLSFTTAGMDRIQRLCEIIRLIRVNPRLLCATSASFALPIGEIMSFE